MAQYRFRLATRGKYICPNCGKKTFVPFVDEEGTPIDPSKYGRCDRQNNCNYLAFPPNEANTAISFDAFFNTASKAKEVCFIPSAYKEATINREQTQNPLFVFVCNLFGEDGATAWHRYQVGTAIIKSQVFTAFWQIDAEGNIKEGHFQAYHDNGHRKKEGFAESKAGAMLRASNILPKDSETKQCLFGLHLLAEDGAGCKDVYLFEAEKTAICASIVFPDALCLATCGSNGFSSNILQALAGRRVIYFADDDEAGEKWTEKAAQLQSICNITLINSNWLNDIDYYFERGKGWDFCDHLAHIFDDPRKKGWQPSKAMQTDGDAMAVELTTPDTKGTPARTCNRWRSRVASWQQLVKKCTTRNETPETMAEYLALAHSTIKEDRQKAGGIKDVGGFHGGIFSDNRHPNNANIIYHSLLTLDADNGNEPIENTWQRLGEVLPDTAVILYTTHKHTAQVPRFRLVFPLSHNLPQCDYERIAGNVMRLIGGNIFDETTRQDARLFYWPSTPKDGEFVGLYRNGHPLDCINLFDLDLSEGAGESEGERESQTPSQPTTETAEAPHNENKPLFAGSVLDCINKAISLHLSCAYIANRHGLIMANTEAVPEDGILIGEWDDLRTYQAGKAPTIEPLQYHRQEWEIRPALLYNSAPSEPLEPYPVEDDDL